MKRAIPLLMKLSAVLIIANEIRGLILAAPVMYALWQAGGTMAAWIMAASALGGIALSVIVPLWIARRLKKVTG